MTDGVEFTGQDLREAVMRGAGRTGVEIIERFLRESGTSWEEASYYGRSTIRQAGESVDLEMVGRPVLMIGGYAAGFAYAMGVAERARRRRG